MTKSPTGRRSPAVMALLAATCLTPVGWAQAAPGDPRGVEFQVNTYTTLHQAEPAVAMDRDGDSVLVWQSNSQDGFLYGIYAQRYDALGVARGGEFRVNVTTAGVQEFPDVAMDDDGNFVVVWESYQGGASYDIYARRYDAAGTAQGGEFRVNATTAGDQRYPAVAMDADGDFVVAWQGSDGNADGVHAQRYDAAGVAQGGEFQVNTYTTD
ncbi:MAG: hypothetical protein OEM93_24380, partial [Rhodospirillales bacterium]|nr:hypothetical protein [Rhodospirillales bacterium]